MNIKKYAAFILAIVTVLFAVSCSTDLSSTEEESRTVMTIDEWEVPYEMYRYAVKMHLRDFVWGEMVESGAVDEGATADSLTDEDISAVVSGLSSDDKAELEEKVKVDSTETLVNIYSLFTAAKDAGIDPFGEMINELTDMKMEEIRATYEDEDEYLETIKLFFMNDSVYSVLTRYEIVFNDLYESYVKSGKIDQSDEAVLEYMKGDGAVRAKQIFISFERHSETEALAIAKEVKGKVDAITSDAGIVDEEKFDLLTDKYGEDLFMFKNRDGYYMCRGYSDDIFEETAFSLEVGHASDIVRSSTGYSIILRSEKDVTYIENNLEKLQETCLGGIYRSMLDVYSEDAKIETGKEYSEIDIFATE